MSSDKPEPYKHVGHRFDAVAKGTGKRYCTGCGLVALNNAFTEWSVRMGCNHKDHPSYANKRYELTKLM